MRYRTKLIRDALWTARLGFWCDEISEKSSNYREFRNAKEHVKDESRKGNLSGKEVWVYTDIEVTERAWYIGALSNKLLFELVLLELRHETLIRNCTLHVVHVVGTRMIGEGTDALSRGEIHAHDLMNEYAHSVPLDGTALQRVPAILDWVKYVCGDNLTLSTTLALQPMGLASSSVFGGIRKADVSDVQD
jgi:hypothetical protein